jgi:ATP-dependent Clp protease ATP-binding subunit ClpA
MGIKSYYENYHRVKVPNSLLGRIALLSERYITERYLPDKAIDLLDESCACSALGNKYLAEYDAVFNKIKSLKAKEEQLLSENELNSELLQKIKEEIGNQSLYLESIKSKALDMPVTDEDISKVIELWTGIPATKIKEDEFEKLKNLQNNLSKKNKRPK